MNWRLCFFVFLSFGCGTLSYETALAADFSVNGPPALAAAFSRGDDDEVKRLVEEHHISQVGAAVFYAQVHYQLHDLLLDAKKCQEKEAGDKTIANWFVQAGYCNQFLREAALSIGDARAFLNASEFSRNVLFPAYLTQHGKKEFGDSLDTIDLSALVHGTPPFSLHWTRGKQLLPIENVADVANSVPRLEVSIRINSIETTAIIRPSSGLTSPITIITHAGGSHAVYERLKLRMLVDRFESFTLNGDAQNAGSRSLALAPELEVGPLMMHNVAVEVIESNSVPPNIYVGMSLLSQFGGVRFNLHDVVLSKQPLASCGESVPMTFASSWRGNGNLQFQVLFNKRMVHAAWRPGLAAALEVDPAVFEAAIGTRASGFSSNAGSRQVPISVRVGNSVLRPSSVNTPTPWHAPYQIAIGHTSLEHHAVQLRFDGQQPTIAFCENVAGSETRAQDQSAGRSQGGG